jgi:hypothetical protein
VALARSRVKAVFALSTRTLCLNFGGGSLSGDCSADEACRLLVGDRSVDACPEDLLHRRKVVE